MNVTEFVFIQGTPQETYCHACGQLRLWCRPERPAACGGVKRPRDSEATGDADRRLRGGCGSDRIEVDACGAERLTRLRSGGFGPDIPHRLGPISAVFVDGVRSKP